MKTRRSKANRRHSVKRIKGGVYKRQGTYGCVFNPSIKCSDEAARRPGTISKLMIPEEADKEFSQHYALKGIDPQQKYLLWPLRLCEPEYADPENNSSRCTIVAGGQDIRTRRPKVVLYKDGGLALDQVVFTPKNIIPILTGLRNLFRGLVVLHAADMAHLDIKPANIVALDESGTYNIRFIDFGLTCHASHFEPRELDPSQQANLQKMRDKLEEELQEGRDIIEGTRVSLAEANTEARKQELQDLLQDRERAFETIRQHELLKIANIAKRMAYDHISVYTSDYTFWPFELRFVYPYYKRVNLRNEISKWYGPEHFTRDEAAVPTWTWYNDMRRAVLDTDAGRDILARAAALPPPVKNIIQAADIYSLGRVIAMVYSKCIGHTWVRPGAVYGPGKNERIREPVSTPFYTLVQRMISPDMFARPTALEAADEYERVISALHTVYGLTPPIPDSMDYNAAAPVEGAHHVTPRLVYPPLPASPPSVYSSPHNSPKIGRRAVQSPPRAFIPQKSRFADPGFMVTRSIAATRLPPLGVPPADTRAKLGLFSPGARRFTLKDPNKNFHSPGVASASEPAGRSAPAVSGPAASDPRATSNP